MRNIGNWRWRAIDQCVATFYSVCCEAGLDYHIVISLIKPGTKQIRVQYMKLLYSAIAAQTISTVIWYLI